MNIPENCFCSSCNKRIVSLDDLETAFGPICEDPPPHRHLGIGSSCCQAAVIDELEGDTELMAEIANIIEAL